MLAKRREPKNEFDIFLYVYCIRGTPLYIGRLIHNYFDYVTIRRVMTGNIFDDSFVFD